ncbi:outer dynein arm-docking complex subunit 3 isoform X2 [Xenopus laevis]|uniref:Outer dynein arm-docking complex subunit 3 isoform X2 n=1 Tax=Xenopus laevis TaxID=8355 RepID=A0A8J1MSM4_XENLA|nr:outer dynein arm-docking complex subunit 3 isoform X2 [Xenopus laevis]
MPATVTLDAVKPAIHEQIHELHKKLQLLDGDHKAYVERSQSDVEKNEDKIQRLRQDNKKLHKKLSDMLAGDEKVIKEAFQQHSAEKAAMKNKSGQAAIELMDQKLCDKMKCLNALHHQTEKKRKHLEDMQTEYKQRELEMQSKMEGEEGPSQGEQDEAADKEEVPEQTMRLLENRLEKAQLKCQEAEHIFSVYQKLKEHMQEESLTFQTQLDLIEAEILKQRNELKELEKMNKDALQAQDEARADLRQQEEEVTRERRQRARTLQNYKKQAEERRIHAERVERRAQQVALPGEDAIVDTQQMPSGENEEKVIRSFQKTFQKIKDAAGVTNTQEIVKRFKAQGETSKHLEELKNDNEMTLVRLREQKEKLEEEFCNQKYSGEAKLSRGQQDLEELQSHLQKEEKRHEKAKEELEQMSKILDETKAGIEHLAAKVKHIKVPKHYFPALDGSPLSDEQVLDLVGITEEKLQKLLDELEGQDLGQILKQMEEEEFQASIEAKLPAHNIRISLPAPSKQDMFEDEEDSGEDEGDVVTRATLKRQSKQLIESKTKRRTRPKEKKGKQQDNEATHGTEGQGLASHDVDGSRSIVGRSGDDANQKIF